MEATQSSLEALKQEWEESVDINNHVELLSPQGHVSVQCEAIPATNQVLHTKGLERSLGLSSHSNICLLKRWRNGASHQGCRSFATSNKNHRGRFGEKNWSLHCLLNMWCVTESRGHCALGCRYHTCLKSLGIHFANIDQRNEVDGRTR